MKPVWSSWAEWIACEVEWFVLLEEEEGLGEGGAISLGGGLSLRVSDFFLRTLCGLVGASACWVS